MIRLVLGILRLMPSRMRLDVKVNMGIVRKMDYPVHDIWLNIESRIENDVRLHSCKKEPETVDWIQTFFKEGDVFYDVGANVGAYSLVASKYFGGKIKVYAFEPGCITFPQLCKNIITNDCQQSVIPLQVALADGPKLGEFNYENLITGGALHTLGDPIDYKGDRFQPVFKQPVLAHCIDGLIKEFHFPAPNHIKLDVDGIELDILKGAREALLNPGLQTLLVELLDGGEDEAKITEYLTGKGFVLHSKYQYVYGGLDNPTARIYNHIFQRADQ